MTIKELKSKKEYCFYCNMKKRKIVKEIANTDYFISVFIFSYNFNITIFARCHCFWNHIGNSNRKPCSWNNKKPVIYSIGRRNKRVIEEAREVVASNIGAKPKEIYLLIISLILLLRVKPLKLASLSVIVIWVI